MKDNVFTHTHIYIHNFEKNLYVSLMHFLKFWKNETYFLPYYFGVVLISGKFTFLCPYSNWNSYKSMMLDMTWHRTKQPQWCCSKGFHLEGTLIYVSSHLNCISLPLSVCLWLLWTQEMEGERTSTTNEWMISPWVSYYGVLTWFPMNKLTTIKLAAVILFEND